MPRKDRVLVQNNTKHIHTTNAIIEFYINGQLVRVRKYTSKMERGKIIDRFRMMYPPRKHQERYFILKPDWDSWNTREEI